MVASAVALVTLLAACGATGEASSGSGGGEVAELDFTGQTLSGETFDGSSLAGAPAVLWFWAPWCPTCRAQAGGVSTLAEKYDSEVAVVGVGGLADAADIAGFAENVEGPVHLVDPEGELWKHFGVTAQSSYVVLDAEGLIVSEGYLDDPVLAEKVAALVKEAA